MPEANKILTRRMRASVSPAHDLGFRIWNLRFGIYNCGGVTEKPKE